MKERELGVKLIQSTDNAERLLSFAKDTRLMGSDEGNLFDKTMDKVMKDVEYSMNTIRGPLEFVHYIFLITNASRAFTHQLVRHRVASFAQQSLRVSESMGYYTPPGIKKNEEATKMYDCHVIDSQNIYDDLVGLGIDMQDARGVLPLHATSAILMKVNLRAFLEMMEIRLCLRVQGENRSAMTKMAEAVKRRHPWVAEHIGPLCRTKGICAFPRYECPVSRAFPALKGMIDSEKAAIGEFVEGFGDIGLAPKTQNEKPDCYGCAVEAVSDPDCLACYSSASCMIESNKRRV